MYNENNKKLAQLLVNYSTALKAGEKVLIEANGVDIDLVNYIIDEVYKVNAFPFVNFSDGQTSRSLMMGMTEELAKSMAKYACARMQEMDAYIGIRGGNNPYETSDVPSDKMQIYDKFYNHPVHHELRVAKTKWVVLRYPTPGMSAMAKMSTSAFNDFYYKVCTLDYRKMDNAMSNLQSLLNKTDKVKIISESTNITFSIKGIGSEKCSGLRNIPDGEIYSAPVKDSVNGYITFNTPSISKGIEFKNVKLEFKDGKIVNATSNYTEKLNEILNTDDGSRYIGEFALGVNPYITNPIGDILFDEKISGSIHFTPGSCYEEANNGNQSAIHWDLVQIQTKEYGGGEIYFDDVLIRKDGIFVLSELKALNPQNLI